MEKTDHLNIYHFNIDNQSESIPEISKVGGKGYSLIKMTKIGLNVPPGFILSVNFFSEWIIEIKQSSIWNDFISNSSELNENIFTRSFAGGYETILGVTRETLL